MTRPSKAATDMPIAKTRLEELQVRKLIQCVREKDGDQIDKMIALGLPNILDLQGELFTARFIFVYFTANGRGPL